MDLEVYCDESHPDLLSSKKPPAKYVVIGSLWLETRQRNIFKRDIHNLRNKHSVGGAFKWQKVSPSRIGFYKELIDWFWQQGNILRFRCIAVDREKVNLIHYHENDQELGFYKFYYQSLHHWITDFNNYTIFCDFKTNRYRSRLQVLQRCLSRSNLAAVIKNVQAVRSCESVLIQLTDLLTGIASASLNHSVRQDSAKFKVLGHLEKKLGHVIQPTVKTEQKFNVFLIDLKGGW
jgi:hypothetical protein